jgi:uncharacterized surface protein with fasciclin (FAS1) repeats
MKTVSGGTLTASDERKFYIRWKGGMSMVTIADVNQSNGVIHVVNAVYYQKLVFFYSWFFFEKVLPNFIR